MKPYFEDASCTIYCGDCREVLPSLSGLTAIVTDAPYGISFMGREWDHGVPGIEFWRAASDACLPGAHLLAFGGTRTFHRLACAIEDAGWEIRDCLAWLYGSGFPKSLDVSKAIDKAAGATREVVGRKGGRYEYGFTAEAGAPLGQNAPRPNAAANMERAANITAPATDAAREWHGYGTALKPAWEPVILARKPLIGTVAQNVSEHGCGAINVDGCRIEYAYEGEAEVIDRRTAPNARDRGLPQGDAIGPRGGDVNVSAIGRWPANVALDEEAARMLDELAGERAAGNHPAMRSGIGFGSSAIGTEGRARATEAGGASRFFYTAKADRESFNTHPTVKPTDLMRWLVRMVAQPSRNLICDPFMGSGSTLVAARDEHVACIGIEQDEASCEIAVKRLVQGVLPFAETST